MGEAGAVKGMRLLLRIALACLGAMALALTIVSAWLFFDSQGLPSTQLLAQFAPTKPAWVTDPCLGISSQAIPYERIGNNLRLALGAAEASEDSPGVVVATYRGFTEPHDRVSVSLSMHIARTAFCGPVKALDRAASEIRLSIQLERHSSQRELFTILANRLFFGGNVRGVESASQRYFHKEPGQLCPPGQHHG